jgi:hypothetical protein
MKFELNPRRPWECSHSFKQDLRILTGQGDPKWSANFHPQLEMKHSSTFHIINTTPFVILWRNNMKSKPQGHTKKIPMKFTDKGAKTRKRC